MAERDTKPQHAVEAGDEVRKAALLQRRAQALRDNLKRRKEQARAREAAPKSSDKLSK